MIGRYDGCFEEYSWLMCKEDIWVMCKRIRGSSTTGFGCTSEVCTKYQGDSRESTILKMLANLDGGSAKVRSSTLVKTTQVFIANI